MAAPLTPTSRQALFRELIGNAAKAGTVMLSRVLAATRRSMRDDAQRMKGLLEKDHLELSVKMLDLHVLHLCDRFPQALLEAFDRHRAPESRPTVVSTRGLRLDQLELMDESQVQERVEMARALQHVLLIVEVPLTELNTYVCALLGLERVTAERNPLRPEAYVSAMQALMSELNVPSLVRMAWMQHLAESLGQSLSASYVEWASYLEGQGVHPATFSVVRTPDAIVPKRAGAARENRVIWSPQHRQTVLTLSRLRRLMSGELDPPPADPKEAFARKFAKEFEAAEGTHEQDENFESTVPAAFEALQEMQKVDEVVKRMEQRPGAVLAPVELTRSGQSVREQMVGRAKGMGQALSLEVVALMVENLVHDTRLLQPIRDIIERLEPALLRLVMVDARFFVDRQHPARRLLQEIGQRGLAFGAADDPQFNAFMVSLQRFVTPLGSMEIDSAEPFALALKSLLSVWEEAASRVDVTGQIDSAMAALEYAEQRNLLAEQMVEGMRSIPDLVKVPACVVEFLFGPWAQVLACAQLNDQTGADDPGDLKALVSALLWSAQPELTSKNVAKLTKLVPRLLMRLREGLRLIDYPAIKTSAFFEVLMKLHQQAFRAASSAPAALEPTGLAPSLRGDQSHWVAPAEVKASGFMELSEADALAAAESGQMGAALSAPGTAEGSDFLSVGTWVELEVNKVWTRTQLSWISPQHTMYLFTSGKGKTLSMTSRMLERLLSMGSIRVLSDESIVDVALDGVVQTAMRNSLNVSN